MATKLFQFVKRLTRNRDEEKKRPLRRLFYLLSDGTRWAINQTTNTAGNLNWRNRSQCVFTDSNQNKATARSVSAQNIQQGATRKEGGSFYLFYIEAYRNTILLLTCAFTWNGDSRKKRYMDVERKSLIWKQLFHLSIRRKDLMDTPIQTMLCSERWYIACNF